MDSIDEASGFPRKTLLILLWTACTTLWSIFTPPLRTFPARLLLFQPLWLVRGYFGDPSVIHDLASFLALHSLYGFITGSWKIVLPDFIKHIDQDEEALRTYVTVFALLGGCGIFAGLVNFRDKQSKAAEKDSRPMSEQTIDESPLPPLLITSQTDHFRLFPQKHGFSYSYLFVGVPVGIRGRVGEVLSVDGPRPAWFDVQSKDYLNRGSVQHGLGEKLKRYLHSQGVTDREYAFAYLVTAPRFVGYSFNPVSFWYIYDSDMHLKFMILEVNNTFDERRMYLLKSDHAKLDADNKPEVSSTEGAPTALVFTDSWAKDFHVSPFNSRKGSYSLRAADPLAAFEETGDVKIDNTIVLRSSGDQPKIVARVFSKGTPIEPANLTSAHFARFLLSWWWVGLATFPRICWEAQKLFLRRKLHVWYRPEVTDASIGRTYTADEIELETFFRAFLTTAAETAKTPLRVAYTPAHNESEDIVMYAPGFTYEQDQARTLSLKVLSPAFYSRFVHYAHAREALDREALTIDEKNRTLQIESAHLLPELTDAIKDLDYQTRIKSHRQNFLEGVRWSVLRRLRCPPAAAAYSANSSRGGQEREYTVRDIRSFQFSELDRYVQRYCVDGQVYRRIATKLFLAERVGLGLPFLISAIAYLLRAIMILSAIIFSDRVDVFDILRPREFRDEDWWRGASALFLANAVHLWSFAQGAS